MPYTKTSWVDGSAPAISASNLNKIEQGIADSFRTDGTTTMTAQIVTVAGSASAPAIAPTGDSNNGIFFPSADTIAMTTSGVEKMRLDSSGQLGIGHLNAADISAPLTVRKQSAAPSQPIFSIKGALSTGSDGHAIEFKQHTTYTTGFIACNASGAGAGTDLVFGTTTAYGTADATEKMRIDRNGNVGIGLNNPSNKIHLYQANTSNQYISISNLTSTILIGQDTSGNAVNYTNQNVNFIWSNGGTEKMRMTSTGNLGIGDFSSNSPVAQLSVANSTGGVVGVTTKRANGSNAAPISMSYGFYGYLDTEKARISATDRSANTNASDMTFYVKDSSDVMQARMRLDTNGYLGIGVAPNVSLHAKSSGEIFRLETTAATGDCFMRFYAPSVTTKGFFGFLSAASDNFYLSNEHNASMLFRTNGTERLVIENAGTVRPYANNAYELGSASYRWSTVYSQNVLNVSDARLKTDVQDSTLGLNFISSLRPVQYKYIEGRNDVSIDEEGNQVITTLPGVRTHFGLIAQEVKDAIPTGLDFAGWCLADKEDSTSTQSLGYTELIAPMIKAIQELTAKIEALEAKLNA